MAIKTFNVDEETYSEFSKYCKNNGISMSKQIDTFMKSQIEENPKIKKEYLVRLEATQKSKFMKFKSVDEIKKAIG